MAIEFRQVRIGVAIVRDTEHRLLWTWNENWGCFALPMSKTRQFPGVSEPVAAAATRAAAEALGVPALLGDPFEATPTLEVSQSDGEAKSYHHTAFPARPHPSQVKHLQLPRGHVWLTPHDSLHGGFAPLSENSLAIVAALVEGQLIPDGAPPRDNVHQPV